MLDIKKRNILNIILFISPKAEKIQSIQVAKTINIENCTMYTYSTIFPFVVSINDDISFALKSEVMFPDHAKVIPKRILHAGRMMDFDISDISSSISMERKTEITICKISHGFNNLRIPGALLWSPLNNHVQKANLGILSTDLFVPFLN